FSSRRRHTRFSRDWSSDVCSSDLFLPDVYVPCDVCHGKRYNRETLEIRYKGYTIHDVLQMTVEDALTLFEPVPALSRKLETLVRSEERRVGKECSGGGRAREAGRN